LEACSAELLEIATTGLPVMSVTRLELIATKVLLMLFARSAFCLIVLASVELKYTKTTVWFVIEAVDVVKTYCGDPGPDKSVILLTLIECALTVSENVSVSTSAFMSAVNDFSVGGVVSAVKLMACSGDVVKIGITLFPAMYAMAADVIDKNVLLIDVAIVGMALIAFKSLARSKML